ncbi:MAG: TolC family protein [Odoribacteraceae bacterium]|jgi:outer membrane protein TolC|nr:TolC family protein [Odoribacteraceae bacterium]
MNKNTIAAIAIALLATTAAPAQEKNLADCILQAIQSNYSIKIKRNNAQIAANDANVTPLLPTLSAAVRQSQTPGDPNPNTLSAAVALNWRIFDGLDMFVARERLGELQNIGELQLQQAIEDLVTQVCSLYYNVVVQQYRLAATRHALQLSRERYEDAQFRYQIKKISGLEAKQAIVDLHADSASYTHQQELLESAYITLNKLMNDNLQLRDYIRDTIVMAPPLLPQELQKNTLEKNILLKIARARQRVSILDYKRARAALLPTIDLASAYTRARPDAAANGIQWGFSMNIPIFNRLQQRVKQQNARLEANNNEWTLRETEKELLSDLALLHNAYKSNLLMLKFESESANIAENNLNEALVMYKLGVLSGIDFRQFQKTYIDASERKFTAMYQAKTSELSLLLLSGNAQQLLAP